MKEKRNLHPRKPTNQQGEKPRQRDLKVAKKSTAAGLRRAKQSESCTDHLHHHPRQHSLRCLGEGWVLRLRLLRSVLGRGLELVSWRQHEGAREQCTTAEGSREEVWAHRRSKGLSVGRARKVGVDHHRNIFLCAHMGCQR